MANPEKHTIELWLALSLAQQAVTVQIQERLKQDSLPPLSWFEILFELEHSSKCLRPHELQRILLLKQHNMSRILNRMVEAKLVQQGDAPTDKRGKTFCTTQEGRQMSRRMWRCYSPVLHAMRAHISEHVDPELATIALRSLVEKKVLDHFKI